jgi:hypothetical protein
MYSFFSGKGTWATVMKWAQHIFIPKKFPDITPRYVHMLACDKDSDCLTLIRSHMARSNDGVLSRTFRHFAKNIDEFLSVRAQEIKDDILGGAAPAASGLMVDENDTPFLTSIIADNSADKYEVLRAYLYANGSEAFDGVKVWCLFHGDFCRCIDTRLVYPVDDQEEFESESEVISISESEELSEAAVSPPVLCGHDEAIVAAFAQRTIDAEAAAALCGRIIEELPLFVEGSLEPGGDVTRLFVEGCHQDEDEPPEMLPDEPFVMLPDSPVQSPRWPDVGDERRLCDLPEWTWFDASTPCTPYSGYGKKLRLADPIAVQFFTLMAMIRHKQPHVVTHEITSVKTAQLLQQELGDLYDVLSVELCTSMFGRPMKRPRNVCWATHKETVDNFTNPDDLLNLVSHSLEMTGNCFFVFEEERKNETKSMAQNQHNFVTREEAVKLPMDDLVKRTCFHLEG